jgi:2,3-bisphosphoglycerate-dependent phosphoglycerate mutase
MTRRLYLIRHAQSMPSETIHHTRWPLSPRGIRQAEALVDLLLPLEIEELYSSPFPRCLQTIAPFSRRAGLPVTIDEGLRERLLSETPIHGLEPIWVKSWEDFAFALPGCETSKEATARFVAAIDRILGNCTQETIGLCTHGNVIGLFLHHLDLAYGRKEAERITNPDVLLLHVEGTDCAWESDFALPGLEGIVSNHGAPTDA